MNSSIFYDEYLTLFVCLMVFTNIEWLSTSEWLFVTDCFNFVVCFVPKIIWDVENVCAKHLNPALHLGLAENWLPTVSLGSVEIPVTCFLSKNNAIWPLQSNRLGNTFWVWLRLQIEVCVCSVFVRFIDLLFFLFFSHASVLFPCFVFFPTHQRLSCLA